MRRQLDEMDILLKKHNIFVLASARKDDSEEEEDEEYQRKGHALKACCTSKDVFLIDSGASNHMAASRESFSSFTRRMEKERSFVITVERDFIQKAPV